MTWRQAASSKPRLARKGQAVPAGLADRPGLAESDGASSARAGAGPGAGMDPEASTGTSAPPPTREAAPIPNPEAAPDALARLNKPVGQHLSRQMFARFTLSYRDVEEMLAERGLDISYETVRRWFLKFGSTIANYGAGLNRVKWTP